MDPAAEALDDLSTDREAEPGPLRFPAVDVRDLAEALEHELVVLHTEERPAASRAVEAVRAAYVGGHAPLLEWIDAARQVLDVEMEEVEVTSSMAHAAVDLDRAVGMPVPRRAFDADASDAAGGAR